METTKSRTQKAVLTKCTVKECKNSSDLHTTMSIRGGEDQVCKSCKQLRKSCSLCDGILPRTEFSPDPRMKDGLCSRCKQCVKHLKRGYSVELIRKNFPRIDEEGHKHTHCLDLCDTELAMGQPIAGDDCNCQLCTDTRTGKLLS